jgi:hypothetical protein
VTCPGIGGYLKAGIIAASFADDSSVVNVHAFPTRGVELGMVLLNLGVWLHAVAAAGGKIMPFGSLLAPVL